MTIDQSDFRYVRMLDLVTFALPGGWTWMPDALKIPGAQGGIIQCYAPDSSHELAYVLGVDVSGDSDEPDVSSFDEDAAFAWDRFAEKAISDKMASDGGRMVRWMSSSLNENGTFKAMTTAYIGSDGGRDWQHIDTRFRASDRNILIGGCFDVAKSDALAGLIIGILRGATIGLDPSFQQSNPS